MDLPVVLAILASVVQLVVAFLALRLLPFAGRLWAWSLIALAMVFMVARRWLSVTGLLTTGAAERPSALLFESVGLGISLVLLIGVAAIVPVLRKAGEDEEQAAALAKRLKAEEEHHRTLVNRLPIAVVVLQEGTIVFANQQFGTVFGAPAEEARGTSLEWYLKPQQREAFRRWLRKDPERTDVPGQLEWEVASPRGPRWVALRRRGGQWDDRPAIVVTGSDVTEGKLAALELEESEARFRTLTEAAGSAIFIYQGDRFRYVNDAAVELSGYTRDELLEMEIWDLVHPAHRELVRERGLARQQGQLPPRRYQFKVVRKGGEESWIDFSADTIQFEGQSAGLGTAFDITRQKQIEAELKTARDHLGEQVAERTAQLLESEERFRALAENSVDVIMRFDRDLRHLYANPIVETQTGIPAPDFIGKTHRELGFPEPLCELWEKAIQRVFDTGKPNRVEFQLPTGFWIDWLLIPEVAADGAAASVITNARDITARKKAEEELRKHRDHLEEMVRERASELLAANQRLQREVTERRRVEVALRESEERFRSLYDNVTIGLYRTTPDGRIVMANPAMVRMLGFDSFESLAHRNVETVGFTEHFPRQRFRELVEQRDEIVGLEYPLRHANGSMIWVRENARAVRKTDGSVLYYEGTVEDVTRRHALEEQLHQAQKMEALGSFAGGVAHDFNNLLMAAQGATELLQRQLAGDEAALRELAVVHRAAERGAELSNGLLAFARRRVLESQDLDLNAVISDLLPMLRHVIPENIAVEFVSGTNIGTVRADRGQIEQILMNLAANSRDAMPHGGTMRIETENTVIDRSYVATHAWAREGRHLLLTVSDTGEGMDAATLERAFEPFFTTKGPGKGTGMGLATVYGMVQQHGGMVRAYSELGKGTAVKIYLPIVERRASDVPTKVAGPVVGGNETILIVEDEDDVRHVLVGVLVSLGYRVHEARDGVDALEILTAHEGQVDLVVTDVVMPRMGGWELREAAALKSSRPQFLFSSGYSESVVHDHFTKKEGVDFIAKPYSLDDLGRKVREILDRTSSGSPRGSRG